MSAQGVQDVLRQPKRADVVFVRREPMTLLRVEARLLSVLFDSMDAGDSSEDVGEIQIIVHRFEMSLRLCIARERSSAVAAIPGEIAEAAKRVALTNTVVYGLEDGKGISEFVGCSFKILLRAAEIRMSAQRIGLTDAVPIRAEDGERFLKISRRADVVTRAATQATLREPYICLPFAIPGGMDRREREFVFLRGDRENAVAHAKVAEGLENDTLA